MDADRRHELKQNELADAIERIRNATDKSTLAWAGVLVAIVVVWFGWRFVNAQAEASLKAEFGALAEVDISPEGITDDTLANLRDMAASSPNTKFENFARLKLAAALRVMSEKNAQPELLQEAESQYQLVRNSSRATPAEKAGAMFQLAQLAEERRAFDEAKALYEEIVDSEAYVGTGFDSLATSALTNIDELPRKFVLEPGMPPTPAASSTPTFSTPGMQPPTADPLPPPGGVSTSNALPPLPPPGATDAPAAGDPEPSEPGAADPAGNDEPGADEPGADEPGADEPAADPPSDPNG